MDIGFIGLGNMGARMAARLVAAGHQVAGYDSAPANIEGVAMAGSAAEAAKDRGAVVTMLPDGSVLDTVAEEVLPALAPGCLFLDCSTVDVETARAVAAKIEAKGVPAVDAPVSGGTGGAEAGTLTFMAGGSPEGFNMAEPLFEAMGKKAVHCGAAGAGQTAKLCNNMILGVNMLGTCEALALAERLELDLGKLFEVVSTSSGYSWVMNDYCPAPGVGPESPADNGYKPGFAAELMLKDLDLAQMAARATGAETPMGAAAAELYRAFVAEGGRGKDFSAMLPRLRSGGSG